MKILVAPNAFKGSLSATDASLAIQNGLEQSGLPCEVCIFPVGDGGDGTTSLILNKFSGHTISAHANDPLSRRIETSFGLMDGGNTAIIEMADISGLKLLKREELDPLHTSSFGTGELIRMALDLGVNKIILGIGGSATVDGGCGILKALGFKFMDKQNHEFDPIPINLPRLADIDFSTVDLRIGKTEMVVLCDVNNSLLGEKGAAKIFGPQKGASQKDIVQLENALQKLNSIALLKTGSAMDQVRFGGSAGGVAAGLEVFLKTRLVQGIEYFLDITAFDQILENSDLVITGEGSIDEQTLDGKGPFGVARRAKRKNIPVIGLAGRIIQDANSRLPEFFDVLLPINHETEDIQTAMRNTANNLTLTALRIGQLLASGKKITD